MPVSVIFAESGAIEEYNDITDISSLITKIRHVFNYQISQLKLFTHDGKKLRSKDMRQKVASEGNEDKNYDFLKPNQQIYVYSPMSPDNGPLQTAQHWVAQLEQDIERMQKLGSPQFPLQEYQKRFKLNSKGVLDDSYRFFQRKLESLIEYQRIYNSVKNVVMLNETLINNCQNQNRSVNVLLQVMSHMEKRLGKHCDPLLKSLNNQEEGRDLKQKSCYFSQCDINEGQDDSMLSAPQNYLSQQSQQSLSNEQIQQFTPINQRIIIIKHRIQQFQCRLHAAKQDFINFKSCNQLVPIDQGNTRWKKLADQKCKEMKESFERIFDLSSIQKMQQVKVANDQIDFLKSVFDLHVKLRNIQESAASKIRQVYKLYEDQNSVVKSILQEIQYVKSQLLVLAEVDHRIAFYLKIILIKRKMDSIIQEQRRRRKAYQNIQNQQTMPHLKEILNLLLISNCPSIDVSFEQSSDQMLWKLYGKQIPEDDQKMFVYGSEVIDYMVQAIQKFNQIFQSYGNDNIKERDLGCLLQKASNVFFSMCTERIQYLKQIHRQQNIKNISKINNLSQEKQKLQSEIYALKTSYQEQKGRSMQQIQELKELYEKSIEKLENTIQELNEKLQCAMLSTKKENELTQAIDKEQAYSQKLTQQLNNYKSQLMKNVDYCQKLLILNSEAEKETENLRYQLQRVQKSHEDLKHDLTEKQLELIKISSQLANQEVSSSYNQTHQEHLAELQSDNQLLKQEINQLRLELNKILLIQTENVGCQVNKFRNDLPQTIQSGFLGNQAVSIWSNSPKDMFQSDISLKGEPKVDSLVLFMPFSSDTYVAVFTPEPDTETYYIFAMDSLPKPAKQLLANCSLVLAVRVQKVMPVGRVKHIQGKIEHAFGFWEDEAVVKDYGQKFTAFIEKAACLG